MRSAGAANWSTQQLTELLALVSAMPDDADVVPRALEHTVESLEGDVGAVIADGVVVASLGYAADAIPVDELLAAARGELTSLDVPGAGTCEVIVVDCDGLPSGRLVLGRLPRCGFTSEERSLFRGFARVLSLALNARRTLLAEREQRVASQLDAMRTQVLLASVREREALLERLARIQRSISTRRPLHEVLEAIVDGASELIGDGITGLRLVDPSDPSMLVLAASHGMSAELREKGRRSPVNDGVGGLSVTSGKLAIAEDYAGSPRPLPAFLSEGVKASMAAPVFQGDVVVGSLIIATREAGRVYSLAEQEALLAFAEHTGLALNDARTVAALHQAVSDANRQAREDPLTGLPNRSDFLEKLRQAVEHGLSVSVLFIDLDDFKLINDTLGHPVGDTLLRVVGERISGSVRGDDLVARLGGDEFAVLLRSTGPNDAEHTAERIRQALNQPFHLPGHEVSIGASTGVVLCATPGDESAEELLRDADVAMYRAKALGKGRAVLFAASMRVDLQARSRLERDLRNAIERSELVVHYQPIIDIERGGIVGSEALLRWQHPELGLVPPGEFIPVAEDTGMITAIGRQVLLEATRQTAAWNDAPDAPQLSVSVNVSARQLADDAILVDVRDALAASGLPPCLLTLELTESVLVQDLASAVSVLFALKKLGVRLAIDDFGTGYSSLTYLARLPVDILKVDKGFVAGVRHHTSEARLAATVVALANALELQTVVEGVETLGQLAAMRSLGCTLFQGYLWSPAVTADAFAALVTSSAGELAASR